MVAEPAGRFHDDQVEADWQRREQGSVGQDARVAQDECRPMQPGALPTVDGLLGEAEVTATTPAHLDDDECGGRARIDGEHVDLGSANAQLSSEDAPAERGEVRGRAGLGGVS